MSLYVSHPTDINERTGINEVRVDNVWGGFELDWTKYDRNMIISYKFIF